MTSKWVKPEDSIFANYIDDLEMKSLWKSFRRKHWGMLVGLLGGFLCGSLVPFAGGLLYIDPAHESTYNSTLVRTSRFEFNGSLDAFNPMTPNVEQPIAALVGASRFGSLLPPWTSSEYSFESFNISDTLRNASLSTDSVAFGGALDCGTLNYDAKVTREWYTEDYAYGSPMYRTPGILTEVELVPNEQDMINVGCQIIPAFYPKVIFPKPIDQSVEVLPAAWLNVTNCSITGEMPLTMTMMVLLNGAVNDTTISFDTTGLLCRPHFSTRTVELVVNASTTEIMKIKESSNQSIPVNIGVNSTILSGAINRGDDGFLFLKGAYDYINYTSLVPSLDNRWLNILWLNNGYHYHTPAGFVSRDPWFSMLSAGNTSKIREYASNMNTLASDSSQLFQNVMAQIANLAFRTNDSSPFPGFVTIREPRITVRRSSLLFLQSAFGLLGIMAICCATVLRPKSCLNEDPATLAALSIMVASSEEFERQIKNKGHLDERKSREEFDGMKVRFNADRYLKPSIEIQNANVSLLA